MPATVSTRKPLDPPTHAAKDEGRSRILEGGPGKPAPPECAMAECVELRLRRLSLRPASASLPRSSGCHSPDSAANVHKANRGRARGPSAFVGALPGTRFLAEESRMSTPHRLKGESFEHREKESL
jgi:hypothetical protein